MAGQELATITLTSCVTIPSTVLSQELSDEMVLLNLETGHYFGLDPMGTRMWQLLKTFRSLPPVVDQLVAEHEVERSRCEADLLELVTTLCSHGLLRAGHAGSAP
jgi:hypothetical protein